jgi:proteasome alpha subunit
VGVRYADTRGYAYSRDDVRGKALANAYSQVIGDVFTREMKPLEVEIVVAEVGDPRFAGHEQDSIYRVRFDGSISDEQGFCVIGGTADQLESHLQSHYHEGMNLQSAVRVARDALGRAENGDPDLGTENLEVCLLERAREGRKFRRLELGEVSQLLA